MKITKKSRLLILAMAIGDGSINSAGYLAIRHSLAQQEYLEWKAKLLRKHGIANTGLYPVSNNGYGAYELRTYCHEFIKVQRRRLYKPSKHIAQIDILNNLTPLHLAIWYMDDGGLVQKKRKGKIHANELVISTYISEEANQVLVDYFKAKWDIQFRSNKHKGKFRLVCGTKEAKKFLAIVEPYVSQLDCMKHKLAVVDLKS